MKPYLSFLFLLFVAVSCGDSVDCDANSFANEINAEIQNLNNALQSYINDPTESNCEAWTRAAEDYLDAVDDYSDCDELDQAQYQQQLQQARDALDDVVCI
jgi:hypothetical protein